MFPVRDADGVVAQIGTIALEITEQYKAEQESRDAEARLRSFLDHAPAAMSMSQLDGRMLVFNQTAATYYDSTANGLLDGDQEGIDGAWPEHKTRIIPAVREILANKTSRVIETRAWSQHDMRFVEVLLSLFPILDSRGDVSLIGSVVVDITSLRDAQREVQKTYEALHQSEETGSTWSIACRCEP